MIRNILFTVIGVLIILLGLSGWQYFAMSAQLEPVQELKKQLEEDLEALKEEREAVAEQAKELAHQQEVLAEELRDTWGKEGLRDFGDMDTLLHFLANDDTDKLLYDSERWVCSHYGFLLMKNAAKQGYRLYPVVLFSHMGNYITSAHMMCFAIVDKYVPGFGKDRFVVAIEAETDEVQLIGRLLDKDTWIKKWYKFLP